MTGEENLDDIGRLMADRISAAGDAQRKRFEKSGRSIDGDVSDAYESMQNLAGECLEFGQELAGRYRGKLPGPAVPGALVQVAATLGSYYALWLEQNGNAELSELVFQDLQGTLCDTWNVCVHGEDSE